MEDEEEETAYAQLVNRIPLVMIDTAVAGWKYIILHEIDKMRAQMPYADTIEIRLICERRPLHEE